MQFRGFSKTHGETTNKNAPSRFLKLKKELTCALRSVGCHRKHARPQSAEDRLAHCNTNKHTTWTRRRATPTFTDSKTWPGILRIRKPRADVFRNMRRKQVEAFVLECATRNATANAEATDVPHARLCQGVRKKNEKTKQIGEHTISVLPAATEVNLDQARAFQETLGVWKTNKIQIAAPEFETQALAEITNATESSGTSLQRVECKVAVADISGRNVVAKMTKAPNIFDVPQTIFWIMRSRTNYIRVMEIIARTCSRQLGSPRPKFPHID